MKTHAGNTGPFVPVEVQHGKHRAWMRLVLILLVIVLLLLTSAFIVFH